MDIPILTLIEQLNAVENKNLIETASIYAIARWHLWRRRNDMCFEKKKKIPARVIAHAIQVEYEYSLKAKAKRIKRDAERHEWRISLLNMDEERRAKVLATITAKKDKAKKLQRRAERRADDNAPIELIGRELLMITDDDGSRGYHEWTELATAVAYKVRKKRRRKWNLAAAGRLPDDEGENMPH